MEVPAPFWGPENKYSVAKEFVSRGSGQSESEGRLFEGALLRLQTWGVVCWGCSSLSTFKNWVACVCY